LISWSYHWGKEVLTPVRESDNELTSAVIKGAYLSRPDTSDLLIDNVYSASYNRTKTRVSAEVVGTITSGPPTRQAT